MNSYSPLSQTGTSTPDAHNPLGGDWHERTAQADDHARKVALARELVVVTDKLATARDAARDDQRAADEWRAKAASSRQKVAELERALADVNTSLGFSMPAPVPAVVHTPSGIGPSLSEAMLAHTTPADAIAQAYGFADARAHMRARLLASVDAAARAALEANEAALSTALDLAVAGKEIEAIATANAVTPKPAKKEPTK